MAIHHAVAILTLTALLPAQLLVVDPLGGGTHTDLQTAILAAAPGSVIQVRGGMWGPTVIDRSLTIVGENTPQVRAPLIGFGQQPPAISLQGTGSETVVLGGLQISGDAEGFAWNFAGAGIRSTGFRRIAIHECTVRGHEWLPIVTGNAPGASGIVVTDAATLHVSRSTVAASTSRAASANWWAPDGAPGIDAAAATVVLLDSTVEGGSVGVSVWSMSPPSPTPCPCLPGSYPGHGGDGVVAQIAYTASCTITGGAGSAVYLSPPGGPVTPYGYQPNGTPLTTGAQTTFATTLVPVAPLRLGATHTLSFAPTAAPSVLALGAPASSPATIVGIPFVFVDVTQPFVLHTLPAGATAWSLSVPSNTQLLGYELTEQRFDFGGGGLFPTNPVLGVVLP